MNFKFLYNPPERVFLIGLIVVAVAASAVVGTPAVGHPTLKTDKISVWTEGSNQVEVLNGLKVTDGGLTVTDGTLNARDLHAQVPDYSRTPVTAIRAPSTGASRPAAIEAWSCDQYGVFTKLMDRGCDVHYGDYYALYAEAQKTDPKNTNYYAAYFKGGDVRIESTDPYPAELKVMGVTCASKQRPCPEKQAVTIKDGDITADGDVTGKQLCIGTDCRSSWSAASLSDKCEWTDWDVYCDGDRAQIRDVECPQGKVVTAVKTRWIYTEYGGYNCDIIDRKRITNPEYHASRRYCCK